MSNTSIRKLPEGRHVAPSILSADFAKLGAEVEEVMAAGAEIIHVDVMDGHFVPPITMGPIVVSSLADQVHDAGGMLDVHLMIERPERQVEFFADAGADNISIHYESTSNIHYTLMRIHEYGCSAGLAFNPATDASLLRDIADMVDVVLCMSVNPGWGGQPFIKSSPAKIAGLKDLAAAGAQVEVDGGINAETIGECADQGASLFVAGNSIFGTRDPARAYAELAQTLA